MWGVRDVGSCDGPVMRHFRFELVRRPDTTTAVRYEIAEGCSGNLAFPFKQQFQVILRNFPLPPLVPKKGFTGHSAVTYHFKETTQNQERFRVTMR
jgi:hypothetical protein